MKKVLLTMVCAGAMMVSAFAQLLDEKNVTITMDLQPVLQLSLQGPDQIDFTFDNINEYYAGITKYGANILRVSASVSFDLWATGLAQNADFLWDNQVTYQTAFGVANNQLNTIPITALELRQFPANPAIAAACDPLLGPAYTDENDYSSAFAPYDAVGGGGIAAGTANNCIYTTERAAPYVAPPDLAAAGNQEKYISGGTGTSAGCQVAGGSYLLEALTGPPVGTPGDAGYFFVMDYRLMPGLPAEFPVHEVAATTNGTASAAGHSIFDSEAAAAFTPGTNYAAPGVYTMYIKYIIVEDQ